MIDGLDADVVTLALESDIDAIAEKTGKIPADWRGAPAQQLLALHLDHRLPGAQGQSQGHQGLGRPGQGRRPDHHAEPEDLRRRTLELSRRLGLGPQAVRRRRGEDQGIHRRALQARTGARHRRARFAHHLRPAPDRRRAARLGKRGVAGRSRIRRGPVRDRRAAILDPGRAAGGAWSTAMSMPRAPARWPKPISTTSIPTKVRRSRPSTIYRPSNPEVVPADALQNLPKLELVSIDDPIFGGWKKAQPYHFGDGGIFDQIYKPTN